MTGTFAGALAARKIRIEKLTSDATGEIELESSVLVIKRIHVIYHLTAREAQGEVVERVHAVHQDGCPVYRSIHRAIEITTEWRPA
ncbi:MAG TPA: OsmC family protein [Thermoanaerobaculia bacterium]|nr:OsmC family protein [Thermoanaerobaculia bacterium]